MNTTPWNNESVEKYCMNNSAIEKIIKDVGEIYAKNKILETENEVLKEQNEALIKQNLMMKEVMERTGII